MSENVEPKSTPWRNMGDGRIKDALMRTVADCRYSVDQGEVIVAAVNSYPSRQRLVSALKGVMEFVNRPYSYEARRKAFDEARSALAEIGEKP